MNEHTELHVQEKTDSLKICKSTYSELKHSFMSVQNRIVQCDLVLLDKLYHR